MAVPHYAYLTLKIPGPKGTIIVQGSFEVANTCDREFNKMAQTFGMIAEYERLKGETDHNVIPDVGRSLPDQAFDTTQDSKKIQVHPTDSNEKHDYKDDEKEMGASCFTRRVHTTLVPNGFKLPHDQQKYDGS
jgi:hypothetical protein